MPNHDPIPPHVSGLPSVEERRTNYAKWLIETKSPLAVEVAAALREDLEVVQSEDWFLREVVEAMTRHPGFQHWARPNQCEIPELLDLLPPRQGQYLKVITD